MNKIFVRIRNYLRQQVYPGFYAQKAKKIIDKDYNNLLTKDVSKFSYKIKVAIALQQLEDEYKEQMDRKKTIEDKAKAILATISISITAITFSLNYQKVNIGNSIQVISLILLVLSILYFIAATIRAIQTINIRPFNVSQTQTLITDTEIQLQPQFSDKIKLEQILKNKLLNDRIILNQANFGWAAFTLVRNGIILFALYFIVALLQKAEIRSPTTLSKARMDTLIVISPTNVLQSFTPKKACLSFQPNQLPEKPVILLDSAKPKIKTDSLIKDKQH